MWHLDSSALQLCARGNQFRVELLFLGVASPFEGMIISVNVRPKPSSLLSIHSARTPTAWGPGRGGVSFELNRVPPGSFELKDIRFQEAVKKASKTSPKELLLKQHGGGADRCAPSTSGTISPPSLSASLAIHSLGVGRGVARRYRISEVSSPSNKHGAKAKFFFTV